MHFLPLCCGRAMDICSRLNAAEAKRQYALTPADLAKVPHVASGGFGCGRSKWFAPQDLERCALSKYGSEGWHKKKAALAKRKAQKRKREEDAAAAAAALGHGPPVVDLVQEVDSGDESAEDRAPARSAPGHAPLAPASGLRRSQITDFFVTRGAAPPRPMAGLGGYAAASERPCACASVPLATVLRTARFSLKFAIPPQFPIRSGQWAHRSAKRVPTTQSNSETPGHNSRFLWAKAGAGARPVISHARPRRGLRVGGAALTCLTLSHCLARDGHKTVCVGGRGWGQFDVLPFKKCPQEPLWKGSMRTGDGGEFGL